MYVFLGSGAALADFLTLFRSRGLAATGEYVVIVPQDESSDPVLMDRDSFSFGIRTRDPTSALLAPPPPPPASLPASLPDALPPEHTANASSASTLLPMRRPSRNLPVEDDVHADMAPPGADEAEGHALDEYRHVLFVAQHAVETDLIKRFHTQVLQRTFELWSPNRSYHVVEQPTVRTIHLQYMYETAFVQQSGLFARSSRCTRRTCTTRCRSTCARSTRCSSPAATRATATSSSRRC